MSNSYEMGRGIDTRETADRHSCKNGNPEFYFRGCDACHSHESGNPAFCHSEAASEPKNLGNTNSTCYQLLDLAKQALAVADRALAIAEAQK